MKRTRKIAALLAGMVLSASPVAAQRLALGPGLPGISLGQPLQNTMGTVRNTTGELGSTAGNLTRDTVGRPNPRRALDKDENGARIVRGEILALSPSAQNLSVAQGLKFQIARQDSLDGLGLSVAILRVPDDTSATDALAALRKADPAGVYDYDHIYDPSGGANSSAVPTAAPPAAAGATLKIGMIDAGIDRKHDAFENAAIVARNFAGSGDGVPTQHGTEVASLLIGNDGDFHGALSGATLYAADVYGGDAAGGAADEIARALGWLAANDVPVANISLAGPSNAILQAAVAAFLKRGHVLVAAVGNDGPASPVAYPAAYPGVAAVTSVDRQHDIQIDANRGPNVAFAAVGVNVKVAVPRDGYSKVTGTSFAAPIVATRFALLLQRPDPAGVAHAWAILERTALRLGSGTRDPEFGYGFLDRPTAGAQTAATQ